VLSRDGADQGGEEADGIGGLLGASGMKLGTASSIS
jgi:hypothetical protein